ncbi:LTA synthase family protein [Novosphingobium sp. M1R2S20]|uniref:LTA synthase family protein n=1 Tax=Novosphingobium rhizovicinum TaxID=3228928 RepID=A0ABV3RBS6_9SPHN
MAGTWLTVLMISAAFGAFMALSGNPFVSAGLSLALLALLVLVSNAKNAMLGEPLLFSDLALFGSIFRHPKFYLSAITLPQRMAVAAGALVLLGCLAWLFVPTLHAHLQGFGLLLVSLAGLWTTVRSPPFRRLVTVPQAHADIHRHGLLPTLLLYWLRWRESVDPAPCAARSASPPQKGAPELIVAIQCESFADPVDLFGDAEFALPGLTYARENAWQHGRLEVSGFGAYTMRTEYAVLFGRSEDELGFRRYDPFLTALGETSYALPNRLKPQGWRSVFVHPHDMRFYSRDRIMPASGFTDLIGEEHFAAPTAEEGQYVTDAAVSEQVLSLAKHAQSPSMIYAVTIENHGPWAPDSPNAGTLIESYLRLARHSDTMLSDLIKQLSAMKRPALLVFFGDHRPSIPGWAAPGGDRHTPYVILRLNEAGQIVRGPNRRADLTPAALHHTILAMAPSNAATEPHDQKISVTVD